MSLQPLLLVGPPLVLSCFEPQSKGHFMCRASAAARSFGRRFGVSQPDALRCAARRTAAATRGCLPTTRRCLRPARWHCLVMLHITSTDLSVECCQIQSLGWPCLSPLIRLAYFHTSESRMRVTLKSRMGVTHGSHAWESRMRVRHFRKEAAL